MKDLIIVGVCTESKCGSDSECQVGFDGGHVCHKGACIFMPDDCKRSTDCPEESVCVFSKNQCQFIKCDDDGDCEKVTKKGERKV